MNISDHCSCNNNSTGERRRVYAHTYNIIYIASIRVLKILKVFANQTKSGGGRAGINREYIILYIYIYRGIGDTRYSGAGQWLSGKYLHGTRRRPEPRQIQEVVKHKTRAHLGPVPLPALRVSIYTIHKLIYVYKQRAIFIFLLCRHRVGSIVYTRSSADSASMHNTGCFVVFVLIRIFEIRFCKIYIISSKGMIFNYSNSYNIFQLTCTYSKQNKNALFKGVFCYKYIIKDIANVLS